MNLLNVGQFCSLFLSVNYTQCESDCENSPVAMYFETRTQHEADIFLRELRKSEFE